MLTSFFSGFFVYAIIASCHAGTVIVNMPDWYQQSPCKAYPEHSFIMLFQYTLARETEISRRCP